MYQNTQRRLTLYFFKPEDKTMCYQVEVLEYNEDKAIVTVGESKFLAYHETEVEVSEGFDDCWDYARESITPSQTENMKSMLAPS